MAGRLAARREVGRRERGGGGRRCVGSGGSWRGLLVLVPLVAAACSDGGRGGGSWAGEVWAGADVPVVWGDASAGETGLGDGVAGPDLSALDAGLADGGEPDTVEVWVPPAPPDSDGDGVPDDVDPAPLDADLPGVAAPFTVYAHTSTELYRMGVKIYDLTLVGPFIWPADGGGHEMTDIAIDSYGVLYGITFDRLYRCHPGTAVCVTLATLPSLFNGLTMLPPGLLDPDRDVLVGIAQDGTWYRLDVAAGSTQVSKLGAYGGAYTSSGDAFSVRDVGTFATVNRSGDADDWLVEVDPKTAAVVGTVGPVSGHTAAYGITGWTERAFVFDASGDVLMMNLATGQTDVLQTTDHTWWGAGGRTVLDW